MKAYTIEHDQPVFWPETLSREIIRQRYGTFELMGDAKRYIEDVFPNGHCRPVILPIFANSVHSWRRP